MSVEQRSAVLGQAASWLGTRYRHHARLLGVGVDCANLLVACYHANGLVPDVDLGHYAVDWHLHHREERFLDWLRRLGAVQLPDGVLPLAGDVAVWQFGLCFSHGGIVELPPDPLGQFPGQVIHALIGQRVQRNRLDEAPLAGAPVQFWTMWPSGCADGGLA